MNSRKINEKEILSLPITTNKMSVDICDTFYRSFAIFSYTCVGEKNLSYKELLSVPCLSVAGIRMKAIPFAGMQTVFFVMCEMSEASKVEKSLRKFPNIRVCKENDLRSYEKDVRERIVVSLAINSLCKKMGGMYRDGTLLLSDTKNFNFSHSKLVCLKITFNEYGILTASSKSFKALRSLDDLRNYEGCIYMVGNSLCDERYYYMQTVSPVFPSEIKDKRELDGLYIEISHRRNMRQPSKHTVVPYLPFNPEYYNRGKLYYLSAVVDEINETFAGYLSLSFADFDVMDYQEYQPKEDVFNLMKSNFRNMEIGIDDRVGNTQTQSLVGELSKYVKTMFENVSLANIPSAKNQIVIFKSSSNKDDSGYLSTFTSDSQNGKIVQRIEFDEETGNVLQGEPAEIDRIFAEMLIKGYVVHGSLPPVMCSDMKGWTFYRYRIIDGMVLGASLKLSDTVPFGIEFNDIGFSMGEEVDIETFCEDNLSFPDYEKINGSREYCALSKDGNVYLVIDTNEIPILDIEELDAAFNRIRKNEMKVSSIKRVANVHKYLRGYIGFHLWKSDPMKGTSIPSYSYISGKYRNIYMGNSTKFDRMPRARRIFVLHEKSSDKTEIHIRQYAQMLKYGFGRWNEMMTYPFPFKLLYEYLDMSLLKRKKKHWSDI